MDLIKCPQCGSQFPEGTRRCPVCEYILDGSGEYIPEEEPQGYQYQYEPEFEKEPVSRGSSGMAIASMVLGIIAILLSCILFGILPGIIGLVLGIVAIAKDKPGKGMAVAGIVTSAIGIVFAILLLVLGFSVSKEYEKNKEFYQSGQTTVTETEGEEPSKDSGKIAADQDDGMMNFGTDSFAIKYTEHKVGTDYDGKPCLLVYYDYTNNGEENSSASTDVYLQAFQNGVELDMAITDDGGDSKNNYLKDVQPGTTVNVCEAFAISDMSDVDLVGSGFLSFDDQTDSQVLKLQ